MNDDNEFFSLNMYLNKTALQNDDPIVSNKAYIDHIPVPTQHDYTITNNSPTGSNAVSEGGAITFTIARSLKTGSDAPSTIYVSTAAGSADQEYVCMCGPNSR